MGLKLGITTLIHNKDDIQFVTEFLCFLGHPVLCDRLRITDVAEKDEVQYISQTRTIKV